MRLSEFLRNWRFETKTTMEVMAKNANLSKGFISRIENGYFDKGNITINSLEKIALATDMPFTVLLSVIINSKIK